jgi:hypothetical protein
LHPQLRRFGNALPGLSELAYLACSALLEVNSMFGIFKTNKRRSVTKCYATRDGASTHAYKFDFRQISNSEWRAYIIRQPGYNGRADDAHTTHRLRDSRGRYVCWDRPIRSFEQAMQVAAAWAEATERYRRTGQRF